MLVVLGVKEYFLGIGKILFEGRELDNLLVFKFYEEDKVVVGKIMKEYFKFVVVYWYILCNMGGDFFGVGIKVFFWLIVVDLI